MAMIAIDGGTRFSFERITMGLDGIQRESLSTFR